MKIIFNSINESTYFNEVIENNTSLKNSKNKNKIIIGKINKRSKSEYQNVEMNTENINDVSDVNIYIHQLKNEVLHDNKVALIHTLSFLNSKKFSGKINLFIITDHYNYYYKEFFSLIYCDNEFQNHFKANIFKSALIIMVQKYFGFRLANFLKMSYHRVRRFLRR
ncbi:hypothetical protein [Pantoea agglomerans]|uniref:hypothetical protein n=1 Tax=Enterobacter agglomerans TaxID=549 RepID=UPI00045C8F37|nr:hypothetical protein [Pantoea agglomerans]KDA94791.1 hypothetical protein T296_09265 [Pantoea agglomerans Eh318]